MNYLGIDWGEKRIGLAHADEVGIALPLQAAVAPSKKARMQHIEQMIRERRVDELVVGYPLNMDGSVGFKAKEVDVFIGELERRFKLPVHRIDERLSSHSVEQGLKGAEEKTGSQEWGDRFARCCIDSAGLCRRTKYESATTHAGAGLGLALKNFKFLA